MNAKNNEAAEIFGAAVMEGKDDWVDLSVDGGPLFLADPESMEWLRGAINAMKVE